MQQRRKTSFRKILNMKQFQTRKYKVQQNKKRIRCGNFNLYQIDLFKRMSHRQVIKFFQNIQIIIQVTCTNQLLLYMYNRIIGRGGCDLH